MNAEYIISGIVALLLLGYLTYALLKPLERLIYRVCRVDASSEQQRES